MFTGLGCSICPSQRFRRPSGLLESSILWLVGARGGGEGRIVTQKQSSLKAPYILQNDLLTFSFEQRKTKRTTQDY